MWNQGRMVLDLQQAAQPPLSLQNATMNANAPPSNFFTHQSKQNFKHTVFLVLWKHYLGCAISKPAQKRRRASHCLWQWTTVWLPLSFGVWNSSLVYRYQLVHLAGGGKKKKPLWNPVKSVKSARITSHLLTRNSSLLTKLKATMPELLSFQSLGFPVCWITFHSFSVNQFPFRKIPGNFSKRISCSNGSVFWSFLLV